MKIIFLQILFVSFLLSFLSEAENCGKNAKYDRSSFEDWLRSKGIKLKGVSK